MGPHGVGHVFICRVLELKPVLQVRFWIDRDCKHGYVLQWLAFLCGDGSREPRRAADTNLQRLQRRRLQQPVHPDGKFARPCDGLSAARQGHQEPHFTARKIHVKPGKLLAAVFAPQVPGGGVYQAIWVNAVRRG